MHLKSLFLILTSSVHFVDMEDWFNTVTYRQSCSIVNGNLTVLDKGYQGCSLFLEHPFYDHDGDNMLLVETICPYPVSTRRCFDVVTTLKRRRVLKSAFLLEWTDLLDSLHIACDKCTNHNSTDKQQNAFLQFPDRLNGIWYKKKLFLLVVYAYKRQQ